MTFTDSKQFTGTASKWLNQFINDIARDPNKVVEKVADFPGEPKEVLRKAILEGPNSLSKDDTETAKLLFNFIEFYATGKYSKIEVEKKDAVLQS